jgi:ubiquinone biosynthesis protein UbiJ
VADPYRALNAVLKQAADKRAELRRLAGQPRPMSLEAMTPEMRARFDSVRVAFEVMRRADEWYMMIRNLCARSAGALRRAACRWCRGA